MPNILKPAVPAGTYNATLVSLKMGVSQTNAPMMEVSFNIASGAYKNETITMKKVLHGTRNDAGMIANTLQFLKSLDSGVCVAFRSYGDFRCVISDVATMTRARKFSLDYNPERFSPIYIQGRKDRKTA